MSGPGRSRSRSRGARAGRSQHFLRSVRFARSLIGAVAFGQRDYVVEIGAGSGTLTEALASRFARVQAIEVDARLTRRLRARFAGRPVDVVEADFFDVALPEVGHAVVANLPFHCTSAALRRLTEAARPPEDILVVVQEGAADAWAGVPFAGESLRSLWLQPRWHVERLRPVPRTAFIPPPRVDAALLWMARRSRPLLAEDELDAFRDFTAACFLASDRGSGAGLRAAFGASHVRALARRLRFDPAAAPGALDFPRWLALFRVHQRLPAHERAGLRGAQRRLPRTPEPGRGAR